MVNTSIFSFLIEPADKDNIFALYRVANCIVENSIFKSRFKGKCRISLGNINFLNKNSISRRADTWLHIIVTGKNVETFGEVFKKNIESISFLSISKEISAKGNAFTHRNDKLMRHICVKDTVLKSGRRKYFRIKEKKISNYVL